MYVVIIVLPNSNDGQLNSDRMIKYENYGINV